MERSKENGAAPMTTHESGAVRETLRKLIAACMEADEHGELPERIDGSLLDAGMRALDETQQPSEPLSGINVEIDAEIFWHGRKPMSLEDWLAATRS